MLGLAHLCWSLNDPSELWVHALSVAGYLSSVMCEQLFAADPWTFGYDKFFATIYNGDQPGVFAAKTAVTKLGKKKLAMVDDRTPADAEFVAAFERTAKELGAEVVLADHITQGDKDFTPFVTKLKGSGAELVYCALYYAEGGLMAKQIHDQSLNIAVIGSDGFADPQFVKIAQDGAEGVYTITAPQARELTGAQGFADEYKKAYGADPGYIGPYAYDAIQVIAAAYQGAGKVDNDAAAKWLHGLTKDTAIPGLSGPLYWKPDGTLPEFTFGVYQVQGGAFKLIK
jgi:branched-chain amino acid transport system substrate-binding protein